MGSPHEEAMRIIQKNRGEKFDPKVVDAFFASEAEILLVKSAGGSHSFISPPPTTSPV